MKLLVLLPVTTLFTGIVFSQTQKTIQYVNPHWSPDGKKIVFESTRDGKSAIYTISPDGSDLHRITDTTYDYGQPQWSPDGNSIVYYGSIRPMQLFINNAEGGAQKQLSTPGFDAYSAVWSVRDQISFNSRASGKTSHQIAVMNKDGTGFTKITDTSYNYMAPHWSPDGRKMLFVRAIRIEKPWNQITAEERRLMRTTREIMLMNADGSGVQQLTNDTLSQRDPSWSHDGKTIYFIEEYDSASYLFSKPLKSEKRNLILKLSPNTFGADISPDGKYITYASSRNGKQAVYVWDMKKKNERKIVGD